MEHSSPVSKVVATATTTAWAQAYSAGKLHLVLSLTGESHESIATLGKETLERLQREFFALDEKTLDHLKKAVETVTLELPPDITTSLVLTTIVEDALYIVIFNAGSVLLKRGGKTMIIGTGEETQIAGFSGIVEPSDLILVATSGLLESVSSENIEKSLESSSPHEISENLAPFLHKSAKGTEAGLVWTMIGTRKKEVEEDVLPEAHPNDTLDLGDEEAPVGTPSESKKMSMLNLDSLLHKVHLPSLRNLSRKQLIILAVIILVVVLIGSIFYEKTHREDKKQDAAASSIIDSDKQKYDDAIALMSLNKSLAVEELTEVKNDVESKKSQFPAGSNAAKSLDAFLSQVNSALGGNASAGSSKINVFFDATKNSDIPTVSFVTAKGGELAVIGSQKGGLLKSDGTVDSTFNGADSLHGISADEKNVYVLTGATVEKIAKGSSNADTIIEKQASPISIDNFGGNIYLLSAGDKTVYKYVPTAYDKANYFKSDTSLSNPSGMTIDASVYVITDGKIAKYTRGTADTLDYKGKTLSSGSQIYTDEDYANLYVLDPAKKMAYVIDKSGNSVSETSLRGMKNISSITADEKAHKMYVVADNKVYSVDF